MISHDEWRKALSAAEEPTDPDALTITELSELLGVSAETARTRVNRLVEQGGAKKVSKILRDRAGRHQRVIAYKLTESAPCANGSN